MKQKIKIFIVISLVVASFGGYVLRVMPEEKITSHDPEQIHVSGRTHPQRQQSEHATTQDRGAEVSQPKSQTEKNHQDGQLKQMQSPKHQEIKESISAEYTYRIFAAPNDPQYASSWPLQKVNAPTAWDSVTGNDQTIVAVIDGGFALAHQDLATQWYNNPGEAGMTQSGGACWTGAAVDRQTNDCDDDGNGYVDDWRGWNFALEDNNPQTGRENPNGGGVAHGTEVAGQVGAAGNNGLGSTAINWRTKVMPLQALNDDGVGYSSDVVAAVIYAVDNGAQVINISLGTFGDDPSLRAAVDYATANNVLIVAASGNCGDGDPESCQGSPAGTIAYPAKYPDVIAVGATMQSDARASFSSYGSSLDVVAPGYGGNVSPSWSEANPTSLYNSSLFGTSFASPQVASLASLIRSIRPSSSVQDITALLLATTTKPTGMNGLFYTQQLGHGIINAQTAIAITQNLNVTAGGVPTLLQAGSYESERTAPSNATIGSGCQTVANSACTIQLRSIPSGYERYLPYAAVAGDGSAGWSWLADMLDGGSWEIRALHGESRSTTPYILFKKG